MDWSLHGAQGDWASVDGTRSLGSLEEGSHEVSGGFAIDEERGEARWVGSESEGPGATDGDGGVEMEHEGVPEEGGRLRTDVGSDQDEERD
jgi:hypothetical protein